MIVNRRKFAGLFAPATMLAACPALLWPSNASAQSVKLRAGSVYEFKSSPDLASQDIQIGAVLINLGTQMAVARRIGALKEYGEVIKLTDDPRAFRLGADAIQQLAVGPVVQTGFVYWCDAGEFGTSYGCSSHEGV